MKKSSGRESQRRLGLVLYGITFVVILPVMLFLWANNLEHIRLPDVPNTPIVGAIIAVVGMIVFSAGVWAIIVGGSLVTVNNLSSGYERTGVYRWISHPVYLGFFAVCAGVSIWSGSEGGLWVITPVVSLVCTALIWGYERPRLISQHGDRYFDHKIRLPQASDEKPGIMDFVSIVLLVYFPWLLVYQGIASYIGVVAPVWVSSLPFEENFPVYETFAIPYVLTYPIAIFAPLFAKTQNCQRQYCIAVILALTIVIPFYLTFPIIAEFRPFVPSTIWGEIIILQHSVDNPATAFPAFHVVWGILCAKMLSDRYPKLKTLFWICAWLIALSCWFTGMHAILDVFAGAAVSFVVLQYETIWQWIKCHIETFANSWHGQRIGPLRIINHYKYAGLAAFICILFAVSILGSEHLTAILLVCFLGVLSAAIWPHFILYMDSNQPRSFGYYGGVLGVTIGAIISDFWLELPWMICLSAFCIVAPLIMAIGRLRCLVQGCCHGAPASETFGITVTEQNTRVCARAGLTGTPVYPTQVYSIVGNIFIGMVMFRMLMVGSQSANVISVYLILSSLARFVEETYRGEPQTPRLAGLNIYHWFSIVGLIVGTVFTMIPSENIAFAGFPTDPVIWAGAMAFGILVAFIMSVDLPKSSRRFSRLT